MFSNANISADLVTAIDKSYPDLVLRKHVLLGLCEHKENKGGGSSVTLPVATGYTTAEATSMGPTVTTSSSTQRQAFVITPFVLYKTAQVNIADAMWSEDKDHAAVNIMLDEAPKTATSLGDSVERALFSNGYGVAGTISSHSGTTPNFVVVLTKPTDAYRFQKGDSVQTKAAFNSGSLDSGIGTVASVNPTTGAIGITSDGTWVPTDTHVIGKTGVIAANANPIVWPGLAGWNPDVDNAVTSGDSWFGVNRFGIVGAAGTSVDCTGQSPSQALNTLLQTMSFVDGVDIDTALLSPVDFGKLMDDLKGSNPQRCEVTGEMGVNYGGVIFEGPTGPISVMSAPMASAGILRVLDSKVLTVKYPGKKPIDLKDDNGAGYIASVTDDVALFTMRANFIFYPTNPAALGNAKIY